MQRTAIWKTQTTCRLSPSLESHPRCVKLGSKDYRTRLLVPFYSQSTSLQRYVMGQRCSLSPIRSTNTACKRSHGNWNGNSSEQQVGLLQLSLPCSQERWWVQVHSQSQAFELLTHEMPVQDAEFETDPFTCMPQGVFFFNYYWWIWKLLTFTFR